MHPLSRSMTTVIPTYLIFLRKNFFFIVTYVHVMFSLCPSIIKDASGKRTSDNKQALTSSRRKS